MILKMNSQCKYNGYTGVSSAELKTDGNSLKDPISLLKAAGYGEKNHTPERHTGTYGRRGMNSRTVGRIMQVKMRKSEDSLV